jgi:short-subunit dehydrogenase
MMRNFAGKTYWIVGASEGLGRALAHRLAREGAKLAVSARSRDRLDELAAEIGGAEVCAFDVSGRHLPESAQELALRVDGIIYCVGLYEPMTARDWQSEAAVAMCEANFLGAMRVLGAAVPAMIARGRGHVVVIGSLAGHRGLPGAIGYGASKAALMHLAENLFADTRGTGVSVQLANPGFIRTRLTEKNIFGMPQIMTPDEAAVRIIRHMRGRRFWVDFPRPFSWLFSIGRLMPHRLFYALFFLG